MRLYFLAIFLVLACANAENDPQPCPHKCKCFWYKKEGKSLVWVDCAGIPFSDPADTYDSLVSGPKIPAETSALDMTYNNISRVYATDVTPSLKLLRIQANKIQFLQDDSLANFLNLEHLDMSYNNISAIESKSFEPLKNLRILKLQGNHLSELPDSIFEKNQILEELVLSHNPLKVLHEEWFESLRNLRILDLSQTLLYSIRPETLHHLNRLDLLDLSGNLFTSVPTDGLKSVSSLRKLILNNNPIRFLDETSFEHLWNIEELEVCHCEKLVEIRELTFRDMKSLRNLTISDNHDLSYISDSAFRGMFNSSHLSLKTLSLRKNSLQSLFSHSLPFNKLDRLEIQQNPWNCDCDFLWVVDCPGLQGDPRCSQPDIYRGIEVHHIQKTALAKCHERRTTGSESQTSDSVDTEAVILRTMMLLMALTLLVMLSIYLFLLLKKYSMLSRDSRKGSGSIYYVKAHSNPLTDAPVGSLI